MGIQELAKSEFPHLTSLTLPLCYLLEVKENEVSKQVGKKKLRAHNDSIKQTCNKGISLLAQKCPNLSHLEVVGHNHGLPEALPCSFCEVMQGEKLLEALPQFSNLRTLTIHNIQVVHFIPSQALFPAIFRACSSLSELYISHLGNCCEKLVRDLALGLELAQSLTILRVQQTQLTQFSLGLLASLTKGCPLLDQLVLVDPSQSHTLPQYPVNELLDMVRIKDLSLLCVSSSLLTVKKIEKLKAALKKHAKCSPHFLFCFTHEDYKNIPGVFINTIFSLYNKIDDNVASGHGVQFDEIF